MNIINDLRVPELGDIETDDWEAKLESEAIVYLTERDLMSPNLPKASLSYS